jgi:hypothetical protein
MSRIASLLAIAVAAGSLAPSVAASPASQFNAAVDAILSEP